MFRLRENVPFSNPTQVAELLEWLIADTYLLPLVAYLHVPILNTRFYITMPEGYIEATAPFIGRFSNRMITFINIIRVAQQLDKSHVFLPLSLHQFSVFDAEGWSRILNPTASPCLVNGLTWSEWVMNPLNSSSQERVRIHQDHTKWSSGCLVRPLDHVVSMYPLVKSVYTKYDGGTTHTGLLSEPVDSERNLNIINDCKDHFGFKSSCFNLFFSITPRLVAPNSVYFIPFSHSVMHLARKFYDSVRESVMNRVLCLHVRLEDMVEKNLVPSWEHYVPHIQKFLSDVQKPEESHRLLILTNGNSSDRERMQNDFPNAVIGCRGRIDECNDESDSIYPAIEQEACAMANEYIGSISSTFSYVIACKRVNQGKTSGSCLMRSGVLVPLDKHRYG